MSTPTCGELSCDECNARTATLETELAAARSERDLAITRVSSILWSGAIDKHTCGDVQKWVTDYTDELARLRAELAVAENWVEHHSKHADDLIGENVKLRADLERFTGHGLLDCHMICDQRDAAVARAERAEKLKKLWKEFITLMDITEESDSGYEFNPNKISSCRAIDGRRLNEILIEARQIVFKQ